MHAAVFLQPFQQFGDVQRFRPHAGHRVDRAAQHVVQAVERVRTLDAHDVLDLLDHADHAAVAPRIRADRAGARFADVAAHLAEPHLGLDLVDRVDQVLRFLVGGRQQIEGDALRAFRPDAGQFGERVDQTLDRAVIHQCHRTPRLSQTVATVVPTSAEPPSYQHNVHHHRSRHIHNTRSTPRESHTPRRYNRHTDERTRNDAACIPQPTITGDYHDTENFIDYRKRSMLRHAMSQPPRPRNTITPASAMTRNIPPSMGTTGPIPTLHVSPALHGAPWKHGRTDTLTRRRRFRE